LGKKEQSSYPICFLVPNIRQDEIQRAYIEPYSLDPEEVLVLDLHYARDKKKTPKAEMVEYITSELMPVFQDNGVQYLVVTDADYFKTLTGVVKVDSNLGYVLNTSFGPQKVIYVPNHRSIFHDPVRVTAKISQGIQALMAHRSGGYTPPGNGIVQYEAYPETDDQIADWLARLLEMRCPLAIDIEAFDLKPHRAGIGTITFSWSKHEGIAFAVDYESIPGATQAPFGIQVRNETRRQMLRYFFEAYRDTAIYHNISYDASVLIYQLYMTSIIDTQGLLKGMSVLLRDWDCTKLISYLATNTCAGNKLSLKDQAQEFAGNYAQTDIKDIRNIRLDTLLRYNLVDGCSTHYVREKHYDRMIQDEQLPVYEELFKPAILDIIQMQLTGLPVNMRKVKIAKYLLQRDERKALASIKSSSLVQQFTLILRQAWIDEMNQTWKKKRGTIDDVPASVVFNPNSDPQLRELLYTMLDLPQLDFTDSGLPATGGKTLAKLVNHTERDDVKDFLTAMIDYAGVSKILSDFIPSFEDAIPGPDGWHYLCGNFNLGGTQSGRLSSSDPNLQNLPAKSKYGKRIKWCVEAPEGWLFVGLDFASLEDKISALTTRDPNKIKVYTDGYDGHSLRTYSYFRKFMTDIEDTVESINSIQKKYKSLRERSKVPTFLLTYAGTFKGIMEQCGMTMTEAREIEANYHELYRVSDEWVAAKLNQAAKTGYITGAFGLRVRTPLLSQVIRGNRATPYEAEAEGRSAGNALGQSWCLLNSRAGSEFMNKVRHGEQRLYIRPCAHIHDAQYYLVRDDVSAVAYTNDHLVQAVQWQDHPDIFHKHVKLGGEVGIFWPTWAEEITLPNGAGELEIPGIIEEAIAAYNKKDH
jgi:DNA polymerase-1